MTDKRVSVRTEGLVLKIEYKKGVKEMAIAPVSSVDNRIHGNNVNFGHRSHKNDSVQPQEPKVASKMVTIPLATLMTLMPLAVSNNDAVAQTRASEQTELLAQNTTKALPFESIHIGAFYEIVHIERFKFAGKMQNLIFAHERHKGYGANDVNRVFVVPDGYDDRKKLADPPFATILRYHNIGANEYCGLIVREPLESNSRGASEMVSEYKLPDDVANTLVSFLAGTLPNMKNKTPMRFVETTNPKRILSYLEDGLGRIIKP